ncbi:MAG: MlaD family protein, partial [Myxococcales bacterium]
MSKLITPFKVGLLVLATVAAFLVFFTFVRKGAVRGDEALRVFAYFDDATGLGTKSRVQIAGIPVGEVSEIKLEGTRAKIWLRIRRDVPVKVDATLTKRSQSILGDFLLDLNPGKPASAPMPDGGEITRVVDRGQIDEVFERLSKITDDISQVTGSLRKVLGGEEGTESLETIVNNLVKVSASMERTIGESGEKLNRVLGNFEAFSSDVRAMTAGQEQTVHQVVTNVRAITEDVRDVLQMAKRALGAGEGELRDSVASLRVTLGRLDESLKNLQSVTEKVDKGEGTLGRLVNDQRMGENLANVVDDASDFVGRLSQLQTEIALRSEFHLNQRGTKN